MSIITDTHRPDAAEREQIAAQARAEVRAGYDARARADALRRATGIVTDPSSTDSVRYAAQTMLDWLSDADYGTPRNLRDRALSIAFGAYVPSRDDSDEVRVLRLLADAETYLAFITGETR